MLYAPKLLLADDEPANLKAIMKVLKDSGVNYEIFAVSNGKKMVEVAIKKLPDLIISDWDMPEMSGIEAVKVLKQSPQLAHIPIIMCTGVMVSPANLKEALDVGASDYVRKPVEATELLARVNSMLALSHSYQQIRLQKEALLELDKAKSRFFTNLSHEFRTPLTVILGVFDQLHTHGYSVQVERLLHTGQRQSKLLHQLINQLLDLTKLEEGQLKLSLSQVGVKAFLEQTVNALEALAIQKAIHLEFRADIPESMGWVDQQQVERVVFNLVANAIKFTPKTGKVSFSIKKLNEENVVFEITDTGIGIEAEALPRIFDRFYQVDQSHWEHTGTGIGLALVKELVDLHGGSVSVNSIPNKGTTFHVQLSIAKEVLNIHNQVATEIEVLHLSDPMSLQPSHEAYQPAEIAIDESLPLVLVVEDNQDLNQIITNYLEEKYRVIQAFDGEDGHRIALKEVPDLIITDVMMPKVDGFELCKRLKGHMTTSHIPIVILTARATKEDRLEGLELGADDYLAKPFDQKELLARVKNLIDIRYLLQRHFASQIQEVLEEPELFKGSPADQRFMREVYQVLEQNYSNEDFDSNLFANEIQMPRRTLDRKFKALIDLSSAKLIQDFRMKKAKHLLLNTALQAGEVGFQVGFASRAYFNKYFKDHFGQTPLDFREASLKKS